jgi:hypothetical protein
VDLEFHLRCVVRPPIGVVAAPVVGIRKHSGNFSADAYVNALGEIAILQYVLQHHAAAGRHEPAIRQSLARRSAAAAAGAFAAGDFAKTRQLLMAVPMCQRSWKLQLKGLIAHAPDRTATLLRSMCLRQAGGN